MATQAGYRPLGVYERQREERILASSVLDNNTIALIAEVPRTRSFSEPAVTLTGTEGTPLLREGIDPETIEVYDRSGTTLYTLEDYEVIQTSAGGEDGSDPLSDAYSIRRTENSAVETFSLQSGVLVYKPQNPRGVHDIRLSTISPEREYVEREDFVYDPFTNRLSALPSGSLPRQGEVINLSYDHGIEDGEIVQIRYRYADADYYQQFPVTSFRDVIARYGESFDENDEVNPMSFASEIIYTNASAGVQVICVPVNPNATGSKEVASLADWQVAIESVNTNDVGILCETSGLLDVQSNLVSHVRTSYNENTSYLTFVGRDGTKEVLESERDIDEVTRNSLRAYARSFNYRRVLVASTEACDGVSIANSSLTGARKRVGNQYLACALAAIVASNTPQTPLSRQVVSGLRGSLANAPERFLTEDTTAGLCVVETSGGLQKVRHGVSTEFGNIITREISIQRAQDFLLKSLKSALDSNIIGRVREPNVDFLVSGVASDVLSRFTTAGVISGYSPPEVIEDSTDPTHLIVRFDYVPTFMINTITLEFAVTNAGGTQLASANASLAA